MVTKPLLVLIGSIVVLSGCVQHQDVDWFSPAFPNRQYVQTTPVSEHARRAYLDGLNLEHQGSPQCVDAYFECARKLWQHARAEASQQTDGPALFLYNAAVGKLIHTAQQFNRRSPEGIQLSDARYAHEPGVVPLRFHNFSWRPDEVQYLSVVPPYENDDDVSGELTIHRSPGIGSAVIGFAEQKSPQVLSNPLFPATAVLRPIIGSHHDSTDETFALEIINPLLVKALPGERSNESVPTPIAYDTSAPMAFAIDRSRHNDGITRFLNMEKKETPDLGLKMTEPYRPGKIPVVFVHGLASDAITWAKMANELFAHEDISAKFQFWLYSYPTATPFPKEASQLRRQLRTLRNEIDPEHLDPMLDNVVLVGHSMGGLVAKLQVTHSGNELFDAIFTKPIERLQLSSNARDSIRSTFFFEPSPQVSRVIFIGSPHGGSNVANSPIGRAASRIARLPREYVGSFRTVSRTNKDAVAIRGIPTSVDLLRSDNPLLRAVYSLKRRPDVQLHSIIGCGQNTLFSREDGDGVVVVSSARHPGVESELFVDAKHTELHGHPRSIQEVIRILREHAAGCYDVRNTTPGPQLTWAETSGGRTNEDDGLETDQTARFP